MSMKQYNVIPRKMALRDLDAITDYIAYQLLSPFTANKTADMIEAAFAGLEYMPQRWPRISDDVSPGLTRRKMSVKNYIIIYTIDEARLAVYIERVLGSQQDWENLL